MYQKPYTPIAGRPLLVMSCSKVKRATAPRELVRFFDLYDGPTWQQVKRSAFPRENVAAVSALYGYLEPGTAIETYDCKMDDERAARMCHTSDHGARLAAAIDAAGSAFVVGGQLYQQLARRALALRPAIADRVTFAAGSYLQQRKQLSAWLIAYAGRAEAVEVPKLAKAIAIKSAIPQLELF